MGRASWSTPSRKLGVERPRPGARPSSSSRLGPRGRQTPPRSSGYLAWATRYPAPLGTSWPRRVCLCIQLPPPPARPSARPPSGPVGGGNRASPRPAPSGPLPFLPPAWALDARGGQVLFIDLLSQSGPVSLLGVGSWGVAQLFPQLWILERTQGFLSQERKEKRKLLHFWLKGELFFFLMLSGRTPLTLGVQRSGAECGWGKLVSVTWQ